MGILKITLGLLAFAIASFPYLFAFYLIRKGKRNKITIEEMKQRRAERLHRKNLIGNKRAEKENDGLNHDFEAYERGEFPTPDNMITPELIKSLAQSKGYRVGESANGRNLYIETPGLIDDIYFFNDPNNDFKKETNIKAFRELEGVIKKMRKV